jgi:primary-amine oxidase
MTGTTSHPLDPLTAGEIDRVTAAIRASGKLHPGGWFETITLEEPAKADLRAFEAGTGQRPARTAFVTCYEPANNATIEALVDFDDGCAITRWEKIDGVQARIGPDEFVLGGEIALADEAFQAALAKRGITDLSKVLVEPWSAGYFGIEGEDGERLAYGHCWVANDEGDNPYARPIANLHPVIDLNRRKVLRVDDFGAQELPPSGSRIRRKENLRKDIKRLDITQPDGPSFSVEGWLVRWQKWHIRVGFDLREGLVLHQIGYEDGGRLRPIMHRASMAEMVVPYGNPERGKFRRNAFDTGEYGIGQLTDSLKLGCDCLGHIHYFDAAVHDWTGSARTIRNAICMHEEDFGMLWKFSDFTAGQTSVARSRRLVISSVCTIGNYIYGFFWYFYQDGNIGVEIKATGIPMPTALTGETGTTYGPVMTDGVTSDVHQHVFSFRFDMAIDGDVNTATEINFEKMPKGPGNPHGNGIATRVTALKTEKDAQREMDFASARFWKVINPNKLNAHGAPVGYKLVPGTNAVPFLQEDAWMAKRAGFMFKHLWVTPYQPRERFSAGWYPNQSKGEDGLPVWTRQNRNVENTDIVVWYTLNYHHLARPEDWPVQPVVYAGFHWMPSGFFDENPAMDVPAKG